MDQDLRRRAPYFDSGDVRERLSATWRELSGQEHPARNAILEVLKTLVEESRAEAARQLEAEGNGRRMAEGLATLQDELIRLIYDFTVQHIYRAENPSDAERMSIIATGGYGRGLLAPQSDIDLLFLLPYKQTAWGESVVEYVLYLLWDLGFKVGHATRTVGQCIKLCKEDMTIRTSVVDMRLIHGERTLYEELETRFWKEVVDGTAREFIEAKLAERDDRHKRSGASRYLVEPNIKDGKGGLRDLHTLHWLVTYVYPATAEEDFVSEGIFSAEELKTFRKCEDFLWTVRCHLHLLTGRPEERLSFDVQMTMAERLGYKDHSGLRAVERFMRHYFLIAKDVGDLTRIVCSALEVKQLKSLTGLNELLSTLTWRKRAKLRKTSDFRIDNGRINAANAKVFERDPVNLIRLFWLAERNKVLFHPEVIRLVRASLRLIDKKLRRNKDANEIFLKLLTSKNNPEVALRRMNEAGVLGRFIPSFGRVVSMMQFNMYHHFTVDEHLIRAMGILSDIEHGLCEDELPLSTEIFGSIENRRALYVAVLLHDIAKGREEDHSIAGARLARRICPRLGLTPAETETTAWLVENHLVMSTLAQSRDLNDPRTIQDFAEIVQSRERLKLLIILTAADIRAVGPGVWNGWKGQLLRTLYYETEPVLAGGHTAMSRDQRVSQAKADLIAHLSDWSAADTVRIVERFDNAYWIRTPLETQIEHATLIKNAEQSDELLTTRISSDAFKGVTEITVYTQNHPSLIAMVAGACAASGANIVSAEITTTNDGMALDTIRLKREFDRDEDEERRAKRIAHNIEQLLDGSMKLADLLAKKTKAKAKLKAFSVVPQVVIDNKLSDEFSVIEASGLDRPGLLYDLTRELANLNLDVVSAQIATFGEKAVDVFYVRELQGKKITNEVLQTSIRHRIEEALQKRRKSREPKAARRR